MINKREDVHSLEELQDYLRDHEDKELPFNERCWNDAVLKCEENVIKMATNGPSTYEKVSYRNGKKVVSTVQRSLITDPIKQYFKMISLKTYRDESILADAEKKAYISEIADVTLDEQIEVSNEVVLWLNRIKDPLEKRYLKGRYVKYMGTYEINEGADMLSLKRILSYELETYRIDNQRANNKPVDALYEEKITKQLVSILESLKWTKKQRSVIDDMAQNKFTIISEKWYKEGGFVPKKYEYDKDEIDLAIELNIESVKELLA